MPAAVVQTELDAHVLEEATAIYAAAGLTLSEAFRMLLMRTVQDHAFPLDLLTPNQETVEAILASRRGDVVTVGTVADLMADLHADD